MFENQKKEDWKNTNILVPNSGGNIIAVDPDGLVLWEVGYQGGVHSLGKIADYLRDGDKLEFSKGITPMTRVGVLSGRSRLMSYGSEGMKTGANPDYQPTRATQEELRMRKLISAVSARSLKLEKRLNAYSKVVDKPSDDLVLDTDVIVVKEDVEDEKSLDETDETV